MLCVCVCTEVYFTVTRGGLHFLSLMEGLYHGKCFSCCSERSHHSEPLLSLSCVRACVCVYKRGTLAFIQIQMSLSKSDIDISIIFYRSMCYNEYNILTGDTFFIFKSYVEVLLHQTCTVYETVTFQILLVVI